MEKGEAMQPDTTPIGAGALSREELIAMAREADPFGDDGRLMSLAMLTPGTLERFAALVAAKEREECAQVCESRVTPGTGSVAILGGAADAIRARSNHVA